MGKHTLFSRVGAELRIPVYPRKEAGEEFTPFTVDFVRCLAEVTTEQLEILKGRPIMQKGQVYEVEEVEIVKKQYVPIGQNTVRGAIHTGAKRVSKVSAEEIEPDAVGEEEKVEEFKYVCDVHGCEYKTNNKSNFSRHMQSKHTQEVPGK